VFLPGIVVQVRADYRIAAMPYFKHVRSIARTLPIEVETTLTAEWIQDLL